MKSLDSQAKLALIKRAQRGEKVARLCREAHIARKTFYSWLKKYQASKPNVVHIKLSDRRFKRKFSFKTLHPKDKLLLINKVLYNKTLRSSPEAAGLKFDNISQLCKEFGVSRKAFYIWLKRYQERGEAGLYPQKPSGQDHYRFISPENQQKVLDFIVQNPQYSVHQLAKKINFIGHHGIQNLLMRLDMNTFAKRQLFAQGYVRPQVQIAPLYEAPQPKLSVWRLLFAPFATIPKWVIKRPLTWPIVFPTLVLLLWILEIDKLLRPTMFFPLTALTFGLIFFLYSLKYYISLIMVMVLTQGATGTDNQKQLTTDKNKFFKKATNVLDILRAKLPILGKGNNQSQAIPYRPKVNPLLLNLEKVQLEAQPFVSIHVAIYNEKRVIERLVEACRNQNWQNYEVILVDDSTDETTDIIKRLLSADGRKLTKLTNDPSINSGQAGLTTNTEIEVYTSNPPSTESAEPIIKLIHRNSRSGFKGGALQKALKYCNPHADYIIVFDSDFVPYPDTIEQFMKSFQEVCGGLDKVKEGKIAAVQGYQWHVLNKSQNWVTRGVRTEYAGSYVIERAGIGIYGGLNMIAGSVFCLRTDVLRQFGWGKSITEDFQLTLRLYEAGYKVVFTPYIQAPAECVSTVRRLIRQRMRWAEGHTYTIKLMCSRLLESARMTFKEKLEFVYLAPYYLQAAFFMAGTFAWFFAEVVLKVRLPFWTAALGWSLVFVNFISLPLMNIAGLFLEESEERDYLGIGSFILLSYILVPFQGYAAVKGLLEKEEGPWFRTPKTGLITDSFLRGQFFRFFKFISTTRTKAAPVQALGTRDWGLGNLMPKPYPLNPALLPSSYHFLSGHRLLGHRRLFAARGVIAVLLIFVLLINYLAFFPSVARATPPTGPRLEQQINIIDQTYSTSSTSYAPTNNSLGLIKYDSAQFSPTPSAIYFEAVAKGLSKDSGEWTSIKLDSSGYPVVSYYNDTDDDLMILHCDDVNCAGDETGNITSPDTTGTVGLYTSVDIDQTTTSCTSSPKNCPVVSYYCSSTGVNCNEGSSGNLETIHCNTNNCSSFTKQVNDTTGDVGQWTSMKLNSSGFPIIAYYDVTNGDLKAIFCGNATCSSGNTTVTVDGCSTCNTNGDVGQKISMDLYNNTNPHIAYKDLLNDKPKRAYCTGVMPSGCDAASEWTFDTVNATDYGNYNALVNFGSTDDYISTSHDSIQSFYWWTCISSGCSSTSSQGIGQSGYQYQYISMVKNGIWCLESLYNQYTGDLEQGRFTCSTGGSTDAVDSTGDVGQYTSIKFDSSGYPVISYFDVSSHTLKIKHCSATDCASSNNNFPEPRSAATVALFTDDGSEVSNSAVTSDQSGVFKRYSTDPTSISLSDVNYTVRIKTSLSDYQAQVQAARLILIQCGGSCAQGTLTKTETQIEIGDQQDISGTTYATLSTPKYFYFENVWSPAPTPAGGGATYFEATLENDSTGTTYAQLWQCDSASTTTCGTGGDAASVAEVSCSSDSSPACGSAAWALVRDTTVTLTTGRLYAVQVKYATAVGKIANAKIVLDQVDTTNGVANLQTFQQYNNSNVSSSSTSYVLQNFDNEFIKDNFQGSKAFYFEATAKADSVKSGTATSYAQLVNVDDPANPDPINDPTNSEVSVAGTTLTRARSSDLVNNNDMPGDNTKKDLDFQIKTSQVVVIYNYNSWLIIQITGLQVPEKVLFLIPVVLFLPKVVSWWKRRFGRRKLALVIVKNI